MSYDSMFSISFRYNLVNLHFKFVIDLSLMFLVCVCNYKLAPI